MAILVAAEGLAAESIGRTTVAVGPQGARLRAFRARPEPAVRGFVADG